MPKKLLVVLPDSAEAVLQEIVSPDEHTLHERLRRTPGLVPLEELELEGPMLVVGQETSLASGRIDLVGLTRAGELLLIEFKTGPQNPDFRSALAQLLDYGSDLWGSTADGFDNAVVRRYLSSGYCTDPAVKGAATLTEAVRRAWTDITDEEIDALYARLTDVLAEGRFHFVVVAQRFTPSMENTVRYLNAGNGPGRFYLMELVRYQADGISAFTGQLVARPYRKTAAGAVVGTDEAQFLDGLPDEGYRAALARIFDACKANGLVLAWGSKGASIRLRTPDGNEPLSIGWILPPGSNWQGIKDFALGVDTASLASRPSVSSAVSAYADAALKVPGAAPAQARNKVAAIFPPDRVVAAEAELTELITGLVAAVNDPAAGSGGAPGG
ncbi:hypothetical protein [Actinoplanes sp. NPDC049681]|uniref:hypothetical protein n=1 Tax=Actinoplanes sp. NPDC049681 TaxID=3363905 RepID=UPI0037B43E66